MEMNRKQMLWLGLGVTAAAAAGAAILSRPGKTRRRRMALRAIGRVADELGGVMRAF